jgi:hypothetical protein
MDKARSAEEAHANVGNGRTSRIIGRVRNPHAFDMKTLCSMEVEEVEDLPIICGDGTLKGRISSRKGVLLEQVLRRAEVVREEDNDTKKMFIIAKGLRRLFRGVFLAGDLQYGRGRRCDDPHRKARSPFS